MENYFPKIYLKSPRGQWVKCNVKIMVEWWNDLPCHTLWRKYIILLNPTDTWLAYTLKLLQPCTKIYFDLGQSVISKLKAILPSSWGPFWGPQTCPCSSRVCAQCPPPPALQTAGGTFSQALFFFCWVPPAPSCFPNNMYREASTAPSRASTSGLLQLSERLS